MWTNDLVDTVEPTLHWNLA